MPHPKVSKITYSAERVLRHEFEGYPSRDRDQYIRFCSAFPLPPKDCDSQSYLRARNRAVYLLTWWRDRCLEAGKEEKFRAVLYSDPFIHAAIVFELTNFIFSAHIRETAIFYRDGEGQVVAQGMRTASSIDLKALVKLQARSKRLAGDLSKIAEDTGRLGFSNSMELQKAIDLLKATAEKVGAVVKEQTQWRREGKVRVIFGRSVKSVRMGGAKARPNEVVLGMFIYNFSTLLSVAGVASYEETYELLSILLNSLTDPAHPEYTPGLNKFSLKKKRDIHKDRYRDVFIANYRPVIDALAGSLPESADRLRVFLQYGEK